MAAWLTNSGKFTVCPDGLWSFLLKRNREELEQYSMFCGHFYRYLPAYLNHSLATFTFLRNPFDRAISHYEHIKRDHHHYFHERVQQQGSLMAFLEDPITRPLVRNFQTRALSAIFDPVAVTTSLEPTPEQRYPLETYLETADSGLDDDTALMLAKDLLTRCLFVGITERMQESVERLGHQLGIAAINKVDRLNTNPSGSMADRLSREEWTALASLLAADWDLYEFGLRLFAQGFSGEAQALR